MREENRIHRAAGKVMAALLAAMLSCSMCGCKATDFFTEVVITPFSDVVDENNPEKTMVNSPDATEESGELAALDWTEETEQSEEVQNLVVYSSTPTTDMDTHHSIFDMMPLIPGIEASDGVRLTFDSQATLDNEAQGGDQEPDQAESTSTGGQENVEDAQLSPDAQAAPDASAVQGDTSSDGNAGGSAQGGTTGADGEVTENPGGNQQGGQPDGDGSDPNNNGDNDGDNDDPGSQEDPYAGYDGTVPTYNPGDAFQQVQRADSIAVLGTDVAVLAQAIGGNGAICAMSANAYYGDGDSLTASNFRDVFGSSGDISTADFEASKILWSGDGASPSTLTSIDALVAACGQNGVIVYDQRLGDQATLFSDAQRKELYAANIMLVPVELSSVQGILDAADAIGDALSESPCANNAKDYAQAYKDAVRSIVQGCAATHGGTLAYPSFDSLRYMTLSEYNDCPVTSVSYSGVETYLATDYEQNLTYAGAIDVSRGLLFADQSTDETPLFFWQQCSGAYPSAAVSYATGYTALLWPTLDFVPGGISGSGGDAYSRWLSCGTILGMRKGSGDFNAMSKTTYGLGSKYQPYLVVDSSGSNSSDAVRKSVVNDVNAYKESEGRVVSAYSALRYKGVDSAYYPYAVLNGEGHTTSIGSTNFETSESPFYTGLDALSVVRANPRGLLGSWTEGSMESVLEAAWLTELYSKSPNGCDYTPVNDMSKFSCTIGGITCTSTEQAVKAFYQTFYRVGASNIDACYDAAVPDQLQDL